MGVGDGRPRQRPLVGSLGEEDRTTHFIDCPSKADGPYPQAHLSSTGLLFFLPSLLCFASRPVVFPASAAAVCSADCSCRTGHVSSVAFSSLLAAGQAAEPSRSNRLLQQGHCLGRFLPLYLGTSSDSSDPCLIFMSSTGTDTGSRAERMLVSPGSPQASDGKGGPQ